MKIIIGAALAVSLLSAAARADDCIDGDLPALLSVLKEFNYTMSVLETKDGAIVRAEESHGHWMLMRVVPARAGKPSQVCLIREGDAKGT